MYIRKTNSGYVAEIYVSGVRRSKSFPLKRDAAIWATGEENALRSEVNGSIDAKRTLRETLERYRDEITGRNTGERWERIRIDAILAQPKWLPLEKKISQVTTEDFSNFRDERLKTVKPGTVLREFGLLSAIMEVARKEWKWIHTNPIRDVKKPTEPNARDRLITSYEIKMMLRGLGYSPNKRITTISESIGVCFLLALRTGMRAGDLTGLRWENIHSQHAVIEIDKVGRRKGLGRDVPLSRKSIRVLEKMRGFDTASVFGLKSQTLDA